MDSFKLKGKYLTARFEYLESVFPEYCRKFNDRIQELGLIVKPDKEEPKSNSTWSPKVFRDLSLKYHPDRPGGDAEIFKLINEVNESAEYEILEEFAKTGNIEVLLFFNLEKKIKDIEETCAYQWNTGSDYIKTMCEDQMRPTTTLVDCGPTTSNFTITTHIDGETMELLKKIAADVELIKTKIGI